MQVAVGTKLGPYEIICAIGKGGMGEVWKARDTRLDRTVAIKFCAAEFSERFGREAKAIAALNHSNICQIHDVGPDYIVMEYVEGAPVAPVDTPRKLLDIAVQISDGLAAAHAAGIIHRDLKPDNVLITRDGRVKILDFGLAKAAHGEIGGDDATRTIDAGERALTDPGTTVGTVAYMSPEQARGEGNLTAQSDQFSLGLVLYELAAGKRAFRRGTKAETMTAIIREDAEALPAAVPAPLRWVIERLLQKEPADRYDSTADLYRELRQLRNHLSESVSASAIPAVAGAPARPRSAVWFRLVWMGACVLAIAGVAMLGWRGLSNSPGTSWSGLLLGGPEIAMTPRISPDGHTLAFLAMERDLTQVAVMKPDTGNWTILTHKRNAGPPTELNWSPDGNRIYFDRQADIPLGIFSVPALGGEEQPVLEDAEQPEPLLDGSLLVVRLSAERQLGIYRFWPESGRLQSFPIRVRSAFAHARAFPDGRQAVILGELLAPGQQGVVHVYVLDLASGQIRQLPTGAADDSSAVGLAVSRDSQSVILSRAAGDRTEIVSLPASGRGSPRVLFGSSGSVQFLDTSPDGSIYLDERDSPVHILRFSPSGGPATVISTLPGQPVRGGVTTVFLPDGRALVPARRAGRTRLMLVEAGKEAVPLVSTSEETSSPAALIGRGQVVFDIGPAPHRTLAIANLSNGRITQRIAFDRGEPMSLAASPDGNTIYCAAAGSIWSIAVAGGEPRKIHAGESATVVPGGQSLLVHIVESGRTRLLEVQLEGGGEKEIPVNGPFHLVESGITSSAIRNGKLAVPLASLDSWFFQPGVVDLATGRMTGITVDFPADFHYEGWTADGHLMAWTHELRSTIWKMTPTGAR